MVRTVMPSSTRPKRVPTRAEVYEYFFLARLNVYYYEMRGARAAQYHERLSLATSILGTAQLLALLDLICTISRLPEWGRQFLTGSLSLLVASLTIYQASAHHGERHARCALKQGMWIECRRRAMDAWRRHDSGVLTEAEFQSVISFFTDLEKHDVQDVVDQQINALAEIRVWREDGNVPSENLLRQLSYCQQRKERSLISHGSIQPRQESSTA